MSSGVSKARVRRYNTMRKLLLAATVISFAFAGTACSKKPAPAKPADPPMKPADPAPQPEAPKPDAPKTDAPTP
jgi:hypothetical protein